MQTVELVDAETIHHGIMVALPIDPKTAADIAVPGGEPPEQLHITLAYLGKTDDPPLATEEMVIAFLRDFAADQPVLNGTIAGRGIFADSGDGAPFILLPDLPALPDFRDDLVEGLTELGAPPNATHGFTPHITLKYLQKGDDLPQPDSEGTPLRFTQVLLSWGDNDTLIPLSGGTEEFGRQEFGDTPGHDFHGNQWTKEETDNLLRAVQRVSKNTGGKNRWLDYWTVGARAAEHSDPEIAALGRAMMKASTEGSTSALEALEFVEDEAPTPPVVAVTLAALPAHLVEDTHD